MKVSNIILLICLFLFTFAYELTVATSDTSNIPQPVNLFQKRASQATCSCPRCGGSVTLSFLFSIEVKCPTKCPTGYYVSAMDLLVSPKGDYHTYIIETTSTDTSVKVAEFSKEQTRYNVGECFSASNSLILDTTDYTTKLSCKNSITSCSVDVQNYCACSKSASKLLIIAPSLVVAGSKFTPEVRIVDSDGNVVPRNYLIDLTYPGSLHSSMASNGIMKGPEITAPSSGTVKLFASINTQFMSAPSLTSAEFTVTATQSQFTCYGIAPSSTTVSKGTCSGQDLCTCFSGYTGSKCETSTTVTQPNLPVSNSHFHPL
ncbi:predicted protein [Naegleria gruberi]|uniref:Predicted protein n=1 Tax=Naegleria gruberi TaxID=5762 RepID=D2UX18_NAEGR|nr:uncharacterized protein NAEGRDRAFT_61604 [Naegleria gruberi]EFC50857.1 predicted protein [Naegleria gruberi]|eukprot:XP_002683601.1 predicted protein [Naegleria gruberi strain NEG-M]